MNIRRFSFDIALLVEVNKWVNDFTEVVIISVAKKEEKKKRKKKKFERTDRLILEHAACVCVWCVCVLLFVYI